MPYKDIEKHRECNRQVQKTKRALNSFFNTIEKTNTIINNNNIRINSEENQIEEKRKLGNLTKRQELYQQLSIKYEDLLKDEDEDTKEFFINTKIRSIYK
jgi:hypothetical protein